MRLKINIITICILCVALKAVSQESIWTLPTPDSSMLSTALIPYPSEVIRNDGTFKFNGFEAIFDPIDDVDLLRIELEEVSSYWKMSSRKGSEKCKIYFLKLNEKDAKSQDVYRLEISDNVVKVSANEYSGYFNALQTLRQLISKRASLYQLPNCEIKDAPAFSIRGIMLDVGRVYMSIPFLKETMRKLSYYKINTLHMHLTDNPGWRIEVKKYPELTDSLSFWKTRQPGAFYTQDDIKQLIDYCTTLNIRVIPEIDMPGHSEPFTKAIGVKMQTEKGMAVLKEVLNEIVPLFKDSLFHVGSDEVRFTMKEFMPEMIKHIRDMGKEVVVWSPGFAPDNNAIKMLWGENEAGVELDKSSRYIDGNGFYLDYMDSQGGVLQTFFQQPCEVSKENKKALGSIMCVWTDGALSSEQRVLEQYPFYPCLLTFAERIWRGSNEKRRDLMAKLPQANTKEMLAFSEFEDRLVYHRDAFFKGIPFAYVKQSEIKWRLIGPFKHDGINDKSFEPESIIKDQYLVGDTILEWNDTIAYGGLVQIRNLYTTFNMHNDIFRLNHWPTVMSSSVGIEDGTCYALSYIKSELDQDVHLMFGLNGMWGHSGGYRTSRAPEDGSWDYNGGDIWLNDSKIPAPSWVFESLPWTGWGQGRIETPLTEEGYFFRSPIKIKLKKGYNKILIRTVFGHWKGDDGQRKWQFCCIPVNWDGTHFTEVDGLEYFERID